MKTATPPITDLSREFLRRFETLGNQNQSGIASLIGKCLRHGHGQKTLIQVIDNVDDLDGPPGRDDRKNRLIWIATDNDNLIGGGMTVDDVWGLLRVQGYKEWPDGR